MKYKTDTLRRKGVGFLVRVVLGCSLLIKEIWFKFLIGAKNIHTPGEVWVFLLLVYTLDICSTIHFCNE